MCIIQGRTWTVRRPDNATYDMQRMRRQRERESTEGDPWLYIVNATFDEKGMY